MKFSHLKSFCLLFLINSCTTIIHCSQTMLNLCYIDTTEAVKNGTKGNSGDIFNGLQSENVDLGTGFNAEIEASKINGYTLYDDVIKASGVNKKIRIFTLSLKDFEGKFINIGPDFGLFKFYNPEGIEFTKGDGNKYDEYVKRVFNMSENFKKYLVHNSKEGYEVNIYYVTIDDENPADNGSNKKGSGSNKKGYENDKKGSGSKCCCCKR